MADFDRRSLQGARSSSLIRSTPVAAELVRFSGAKAAWWTHSANRESGPNHLSEMTVIHVHQKASDQ
ncbi:MAG TPA: hypothetical protein VHK03_02855 [Aestuariivirgaceae bacterium]|nr:hypothetical protein [Aestuariivirgaceae bacterium]